MTFKPADSWRPYPRVAVLVGDNFGELIAYQRAAIVCFVLSHRFALPSDEDTR
jgi:hypothetical protein